MVDFSELLYGDSSRPRRDLGLFSLMSDADIASHYGQFAVEVELSDLLGDEYTEDSRLICQHVTWWVRHGK